MRGLFVTYEGLFVCVIGAFVRPLRRVTTVPAHDSNPRRDCFLMSGEEQ